MGITSMHNIVYYGRSLTEVCLDYGRVVVEGGHVEAGDAVLAPGVRLHRAQQPPDLRQLTGARGRDQRGHAAQGAVTVEHHAAGHRTTI